MSFNSFSSTFFAALSRSYERFCTAKSQIPLFFTLKNEIGKQYKKIQRYYIIMENNKPTYLKTDNNRVINENAIRWVEKMSDCLEVCLKTDGCSVEGKTTIRICKLNNPDSYNILNKHFGSS